MGEISDYIDYGLNVPATIYDGINKYIRITDINDESRKFNYNSLTSPDINLTEMNNYKLKKGDILFARTGASVGKTYIYHESDGEVYFAGFLIRAHINKNYVCDFVFQSTLTKNYNDFISIMSARSGQPGVNAKEYSLFQLNIPKNCEQNYISKILSNLDHLITLQQRELELMKTMKKSFLKKMFV